MKILFLSTLNFATNPRFYKEIRLARQSGIEVEIICFEFNNWSYSINKDLINSLSDCRIHLIQGNRKPFLQWAMSVFKERLYRLLGRANLLSDKWLSQAVSRRSDLLIKYINRLSGGYDLVIGHNPGALYPVYFAAKKFNCKSGFDVEDYHPGEGKDKLVQQLTMKLMTEYLPKMDYVTFAAPLMWKKHAEDIGSEGTNWKVILNAFPKEQFEYNPVTEGPLRLLWFSQNVNYNRGLEQWIPALEPFSNEIELTLIGNKKEPFYSEYVKGRPFVNYISPMDLKELNRKVCGFDIGLALEPGKDQNNIISIPNKLITYYQAGLYILASNTPGQREFLQSHPHTGMILSPEQDGFLDKISQVIESKDSIRRTKKERFLRAKELSWEGESEKLLRLWSEVAETDTEVSRQGGDTLGRVAP